MCILLYRVYEKSGKINKTQKNPKKPNKTQKKPNPYPIKGQTGIGFFWVTPPPPKFVLSSIIKSTTSYYMNIEIR